MANKNKTPAYVDKAIKWLESRSPEGEQLAFINAEEARMLKDAGGSGEDAVGGIPSYQPPGVGDGAALLSNAASFSAMSQSIANPTFGPGAGLAPGVGAGQGFQRRQANQQAQEDADFIRQLREATEAIQNDPSLAQSLINPAFTGGAATLSGVEALQDFPQPPPPVPTVPQLEVPTLTPGTVGQELIEREGLQVGERPDITAPELVTETGITPAVPTRVPAALTETATVADTGTAAAATQAAPTEVIGDIQEAIPPEELAQAATADLDQRATVEFQLERVTSAIRDGEPLPPWAAPVARNVDSVMLQRGLGSSSMAASARTQALIESGLQIATTDAQAYGRIQLQNLNNQQTTALQNASTLAAMRTQNLNARMTAAVNNAQNFLTIDTANLTNQQASNTLSYNAFTQGLFSDQAAENASRQFNATTENQVEQFFTTLDTSVEEANANRTTAIRQFNAGETNAHEQFYENQRLTRETFNSSMEASIRAANANWRRSVTTINNGNQMAANQFAAQATLGLREREYNNLWQRHRDDARFIFESAERGLDREAQTAALAQQAAIARGNQSSERSGALFGTIASLASTIIPFLSDIRLKSNIEKIGELNSVINLYRWEWNEVADQIGVGDQPTIGVLAQELIEYRPDLVVKGHDGYFRVNYSGLV